MRKLYLMIVAAGIILAISLTAGVAYAWYAERAEAAGMSAKGDLLRVELTGGDTEDPALIHPGEGSRSFTYTVYNPSKERTIHAVFVPGELNMYLLPSQYLITDGAMQYVDKNNRDYLKNLDVSDKMDLFESVTYTDEPEVIYGTGGNGAPDWIISEGSDYVEIGIKNETHFTLAPGGSAECTFTVGLTPGAGNAYQYALFILGDAKAFATQDVAEAISYLKGAY